MKTFRASWVGGNEWGVWDGSEDPDPTYIMETEQLEPTAYIIERWEYGKVVESWKTDDGKDLRQHLARLSELMDTAPESFIDKDLVFLANWCYRHDLELVIRTS